MFSGGLFESIRPRARNPRSTTAELSLVPLKSCLVNLPTVLESLLVSVNTPAQNAIVELNFRPSNASSSQPSRSVYLGWTGMPSKHKTPSLVGGRDSGYGGLRGQSRESEAHLVEIDSVLATTLGLHDGQKVLTTVHIDPPQAHTINIEPLTPEDWEIIELHATFLELNLLSQIRAVPNPFFKPASGQPTPENCLTVHLTPTSTANIVVTSIEPAPSAEHAFAKIAPDAEVIVAPKTRPKTSARGTDTRSVASTTKSKRSSATKRVREEPKPAIYLRGLDCAVCDPYSFGSDDLLTHGNLDFTVWVDSNAIAAGDMKGVNYVVVELLRPSTGPKKVKPEDAGNLKPETKLVARLKEWDDAATGQSVALSSPLCAALGSPGLVGGVVKIQAALPQTTRPKHIKVFPFATRSKEDHGLKFGGESKAEKEESARRIWQIYSGGNQPGHVFGGPVTDGMLLGIYPSLGDTTGWEGGILKIEDGSSDKDHHPCWLLGIDEKAPIEVQPPIPPPVVSKETEHWDPTPAPENVLAGVDSLFENLYTQLRHMSSTLLTGPMGAGKSELAKKLAQRIRSEELYYTIYFPCKTLVNDETRLNTVKDNLVRIFTSASWGARLGGKALVVLDDLDKLCPVETELQVGNDNSRSRILSETVCAMVKQYCAPGSGVVLLATAGGKDTINKVILGGHMVRDTIEMKAPHKEARREILSSLILKDSSALPCNGKRFANDSPRNSTAVGPSNEDSSAAESTDADDDDWMETDNPKSSCSRRRRAKGNNAGESNGFIVDADLDFLEIAGLTDGYMPVDLSMLVSRARSEAMFRAISASSSHDEEEGSLHLTRADFDKALQGFTPATLRNVPLQKSTTTFASIGGLTETRQVLLETLQYPTKYAPIFAKCPLRLRSGLLLYGYPGCGKTMLAGAVAGECGLNFISVKGPEILNKYIGASEKSVRDLFERAQAAKPCVLFFDEFDSIAPKRGHDSTGVTDRVVNQLLTQMDGAEGLSGVYVLAATSRPDLIDSALLRPGRLDKSLLCGLPTAEDRQDIVRALCSKIRLSDDLLSGDKFAELGRRTEGFSGADLQALVSNAQLEAIHDVLNVAEGQLSTTVSSTVSGKPRNSGSVPSFVKFKYGADDDASRLDGIPKTRSAELAENAAILAKLESIKAARKRAHGSAGGDAAFVKGKSVAVAPRADTNGKKEANGGGVDVVTVGWKHLAAALENTRPSISAKERMRLEKIYAEFVGARSGEMKDGQGSSEIGGRSSLM
ncbi:Peroxisome biosynthesis protein PAS1 [Ceratocystis fimbriata CBS 114723]|uniref:Peroxisomal ATPase PEX1 n=1 Tax=Ceratocystis fimbriata CBS 114723 TaxID=1035309 RepID=A0A2C5XMJ1_9PEZI|nr:Peroxisome biosynthesis protein PAS1 [Ceratocystis fimbriata CBS 114723]